MSDIRNIVNVDNKQGSTYNVEVLNQEEKPFVINKPVFVKVDEEKPTGGLWTPWCDEQKGLVEGHRIAITLTKGKESNLYYMFQSGANLYYTASEDWSKKKVLGGDYNKGKGDYVLKINNDDIEPVFSVMKL